MARYGGGSEDFKRQEAEMRALRAEGEKLAAKEAAYQNQLAKTPGLEEDAKRAARTTTRARREAAEVAERQAKLPADIASKTRLETEAVERLTRARRRAADAAQAEAVNVSRALRGARDPLFGQAHGVAQAGGGVRQMRQQLGVGYGRASALNEAILGRFQPGNAGAPLPMTQVRNALLNVEKAEAELAQATRALTNTRRRASATDADRVAAREAQIAATRRRETARSELDAARAETAEKEKNRQAVQEERTARERAARAPVARAPGTDIVPHPTLFPNPQAGGASAFRGEAYRQGQFYRAGSPAYDALHERESGARKQAAVADHAAAQQASQQAAILEERQRRLAVAYEETDRRASALNKSVRGSAVAYGSVSQVLTRHGALTSEFIAAAARGEVTLKQLGEQSLLTTGKFLGWTAAATAIYGAAAAIHRLGEGAIQSQSGVQQLYRVVNQNRDPDAASKSFRDLAGDFNVPIATAADAAYRMGQVFHDQGDAIDAAKAALYSYKTGEVDVATSTQNLIAITNGFQLTSQETLAIYDQINQAQNVFGIRIGDTEAGLAKAAGTYKNAGGDLSYLLGIFVAIQKATGRSGNEIGTGIARGVNQIRQAKNQAKLGAQGVDVDPLDFQSTLQSALAAARRPGADIQALSSGLLGNQYARLIAPVLADQRLLNRALNDTSPEASKGSAQRELKRVLQESREEIAKVGVNLERLGSALADAGFFNVLALGLKSLNLMLDVSVRLLDVFNELPKPLRQAVVLMAQAGAALAVARRLGGTDRAIGTPFQFLANPDQRVKTFATRGLRDARDEARNEQERYFRTAYRDSVGARVSFGEEERLRNQHVMLVKSGAAQEEIAKAEAAYYASTEKTKVNAEKAKLSATQAADARAIANRAEQELNELQRVRPVNIRSHLARQGTPIPGELGKPSSVPPSVLVAGGGSVAALREADSALAAALGASPTEYGRRVTAVKAATERYSTAMRFAAVESGHAARVLLTGTAAATRGFGHAAELASGASGAAGRLRSGVASFVRGLGVLDVALIAGLAFLEFNKASNDSTKKLKEAESYYNQGFASQSAYRAALKKAREQKKEGDASLGDVLGDTGKLLADVVSTRAFRSGYILPTDRRKLGADEARKFIEEQQRVDALKAADEAKARTQGDRPISGRFYGEVIGAARDAGKRASQGLISMGELNKELDNRLVDLQVSSSRIGPIGQARGKAEIERLRRQIRAQLDPTSFAERFSAASTEEISTYFGLAIANLGRASKSGRGGVISELQSSYKYILRNSQGTSDPKVLTQLAQIREQFYGAIKSEVDQEIQDGLALANTEGARHDVFQSARRLARQGLAPSRDNLSAARSSVETARKEYESAQERSDSGGLATQRTPGASTGSSSAIARENAKRAVVEAKKKVAAVRAAKKNVKQAQDEYDEALKRYRLLSQEISKQEYSDSQEGRQINLAYRQSQTADPAQRAALAVRSASASVRDARGRFGNGSREYRQAMTELNDARRQAAQAIVDNVQAENAIMLAQASGDPAASARAGVAAARAVLQAMLKNRSEFSVAEIKQQRAQLITAQIQANEAARQAAAELRDARFDYQSSLTEDPLKQAQIEVKRTRAALNAPGQSKADKLHSRAEYNRARQSERRTRVEQAEGTIDFNLEMEKITRDEAISQYESLLKTRGITKEMRRDILRRIKQLKDEGDEQASGFDLDIGSLKLPTVYDVRRAFGAVRNVVDHAKAQTAGEPVGTGFERQSTTTARSLAAAASGGMSMTNNVTVIVNDKRAAGDVYDALDKAMRTSVKAKMRTAGIRATASSRRRH